VETPRCTAGWPSGLTVFMVKADGRTIPEIESVAVSEAWALTAQASNAEATKVRAIFIHVEPHQKAGNSKIERFLF